jgi:hypothetical protein
VLTEHNLSETQFAESLEPLQERRPRNGRTAVRLQNLRRTEVSGDVKEEGSQFELELRSTLA